MRFVQRVYRLPRMRMRFLLLAAAILTLSGLAIYGAVTNLDKGEKIASVDWDDLLGACVGERCAYPSERCVHQVVDGYLRYSAR